MDSQLLKIATLNLCLGLKYKKDLVKNYLYSEEIDILAVQETEIEKDFNCDLLSIKGFKYEYEENLFKKREGFYVKNCIKYERKRELEGTDSHLIANMLSGGSINLKGISSSHIRQLIALLVLS